MELNKQEIQEKIECLRTGKFLGRQHRIHMNNGKGKPLCNVKKWQCLTPSYMVELENVECIFCLKRILTKLNNGNDGIPPKPKDLGILPTIT